MLALKNIPEKRLNTKIYQIQTSADIQYLKENNNKHEENVSK